MGTVIFGIGTTIDYGENRFMLSDLARNAGPIALHGQAAWAMDAYPLQDCVQRSHVVNDFSDLLGLEPANPPSGIE